MIGAVGTALGQHGVNIATFALGRSERGAIGVVGVDPVDAETSAAAVAAVRRIPAVTSAELVRL